MNFFKRIVLTFFVCLLFTKSFSQFVATWPLNNTVKLVGNKGGTQQANITIANAILGSEIATTNFSNSTGVKLQPASTDWVTTPTDNWHVDFPLSPVVGNDIVISGLSFQSNLSGGNSSQVMVYSLAAQDIVSGKIVFFGTPQTATGTGMQSLNFTGFSKKLYSGRTYNIRIYIHAAATGTTKSKSVTLFTVTFNGNTVAAGTQPTVTTSTAVATGKYTATATGTVTAGTYNITQSGVVWDVNANPTTVLTTKTTNGPTATGAINLANGGSISGLTAGITYNVRAYVESETGDVFYGTNMTFTTNPPTIPSLTTNAVSNITSIKATSGGAIIDSGGVGITKKGVCWSTTANPTIANNITNDGIGNATYSSLIKTLAPATLYHVRAYATNSIGTGYGADISFTTNAPEPIITTTTPNGLNSIPFGDVIINQTSVVKSYTLTASALQPASGNITITAPANYEVSLTAGSGFANSINVAYTGNSIAATTVYVKFKPTSFGAINGTITHTGGGATAINIDDVMVTGNGIQNPSDLSNTGTDFWVGYGFQSLMTGSNSQEMVLYMSSAQNAVVTVEIGKPGDANYYIQTYNLTANNAMASLNIPKTGVQDARLNSSGVLPKGIHVYSNGIPFSLWSHIYAGSSSGATLVLPTNTWGSTYSVLTVGGKTNNGVPHSFFFVQAAEDNTIVDITPADDITATASGTTALYPAGVPFSITLNKGDVFNALGKLIASDDGVDLTGTTVVSRDCNKKIALFTGNGRVELRIGGCIPQTGGSDNFIQQMFPKQAWGTKYVTSPFRDMEAGLYKIVVSDPSTVVLVNGNIQSGLVQNAYTYQTDTLLNIESDKPVMVAQFCATNKCVGTGLSNHQSTGTDGDPEMVVLSPTQQAINDVTVYSTNNSNIKHNYINVIIPKAGVAGFMFDGVNASAAFSQHTADTNYWYASFNNIAGNTSHRLQSNIDFNAIAYGFSQSGSNESYGYCAGTHLRALNQFITVNNQYPNLTNDSIIPTCLNTQFKYSVLLPYKPQTMHWDFYNNPIQLPNSDTVLVTNPTPVDSFNVNGTRMYKYSLPTSYSFSGIGQFPVKITMNTTNADGCSGVQIITFTLKVVEPPTPYFTQLDSAICGGNIFNLDDSSYDKNGYAMVGREWTFGGGLIPGFTTIASPGLIAGAGTYSCNIRAINSIGCYKDSAFTLVIYDGPNIDSILTTQAAFCAGKTVNFTARYTPTSLPLGKFYWDFGDGTKDSSATNTITHTYTNANTTGYTVSVYGVSAKGCFGNTKTLNLPVHLLKAGYKTNAPQCINSVVNFTDTSKGTTVSAPLSVSYTWGFGDASANATVISPNHIYTIANTYTTWQKIVLKDGATVLCEDSISQPVVITPTIILSNLAASNNNYDCINKPVTFTAIGTTATGTIKWYWASSDGRKDTTTTNTLTRQFATAGTYTISVFATVNGGCASNTTSTTQYIHNLHANMNFTSPQCVNTAVQFTDASTGTVTSAIYDTKYLWSFKDAANTISVLPSPPFTYSTAGTYNVKMRVSLLAGLVEFCADSITKTLIISPNLATPNITADASKTTTSSLTFNWTSVLNATDYKVNVNGGAWTNPSTGTTGLQHVLTSLAPNTAYTVCVKPQGTCLGDSACATATTAIENQQVKIPNTFTPNGDKTNDKFTVCSNTIQSVKMIVFSQWGEKLYESLVNTPTLGDCFETWDGYAFGKPQPVGVYAYVVTITMKDGKVMNKKGLLNLIR